MYKVCIRFAGRCKIVSEKRVAAYTCDDIKTAWKKAYRISRIFKNWSNGELSFRILEKYAPFRKYKRAYVSNLGIEFVK